jgi:hypothetical protein
MTTKSTGSKNKGTSARSALYTPLRERITSDERCDALALARLAQAAIDNATNTGERGFTVTKLAPLNPKHRVSHLEIAAMRAKGGPKPRGLRDIDHGGFGTNVGRWGKGKLTHGSFKLKG